MVIFLLLGALVGCLKQPPGSAAAPVEAPPVEVPEAQAHTSGCEAACPSSGPAPAVTEVPIPVTGFSADQVLVSYTAALAGRPLVEVVPSPLQACLRCGSADAVEGVLSAYGLRVYLPVWTPDPSVGEADRAAIERLIARTQGQANRRVGLHRAALDGVSWRGQTLGELQGAVTQACGQAVAAVAALDAEDGCLTIDGVSVVSRPMTECNAKWKAPGPEICTPR